MSRRFRKVLTNAFHVSFLETIENDACDRYYTLDIEAQSDDPTMFNQSMYIKLCHSQEECTHYEIPLDEFGRGCISIENQQAITINVVQVDDCGNQVMNQDGMEVTYVVEDEVQQEDYARLHTEDLKEHYTIRIENHVLQKAALHIQKKIAVKGELQLPEADECFTIYIEGMGICQYVTLDQNNDFSCCLEDIPAGRYSISELNEFHDVIYQFNGQQMEDSNFILDAGENTLDIINATDFDTTLTITKYIRNERGELCRPQCDECFAIRIISDRHDVIVNLSEENDFCVVLHGLIPGYYRIDEQSDCDIYDTTYIVNDACERNFAHLEINECGENQVMIINTLASEKGCQPPQESQLRICKFIRSKDGCLRKPCHNENFQVTLSGCGLCQTLNLNESNNYCVDIASLCSGDYRIEETSCHDYVSSYIVDDDMERTSACIRVEEGSTFCVTIINSMRNSGLLRVCKYIRNDYGDLMKPDKQQCFDMTLSSLFCKRNFTLNAENDWCMCFDDLRLGSYEVKEARCNENDYAVVYQVDCGKESTHARFMMDGEDREVKVINYRQKQNCGTLRICKFEETNCGELVKPQRDEVFHVHVEGDGLNECYSLKASNNWCILLDGLKMGEYHIQEEEEDIYDACYIVNGCRDQEAYVLMQSGNEEVTILNHRKRNGIVTINAMLQDCDKTISQPYEGMDIEVLVEGKDTCYHVCLNAQNNWCVLLDALPQDTYRIIQKDSFGFVIHYVVNGCACDFARIALNQEDQEITIINEIANCAGMVKVTKFIEDECGELSMPCRDDEFHFELKGVDFASTYTLCEKNDFCVYFDDLRQGCYEIKELSCDYDARYLINHQPVDDARFTLGKEDVYVDILNKASSQHAVTIEKRIRKGDELVIPQVNDCFKVLLTGRNTHEIFELNDDNDFCISLNDLCNQHYEIKELGACAKSYIIDGCEQENGYFLYEGMAKQITIVNEEERTGALRLEKLIEDACGTYIRPQRWESFDIMLEGECYKRKVTLDIRNNFCACLYDLPCGHYEIKEVGSSHSVSYMIHDMPCDNAIIDLRDEDVNVTIINHEAKNGCLHFQGLVEKDGEVIEADPLDEFILTITCGEDSQNVVLHAGNDFCASMEQLEKGNYSICEGGKENVAFLIEDQRFDDCVCVELNGEYVDIRVVKHKENKPSITIQKWMIDKNGKRQVPHNDDHFMMTMLFKGRKQMFELHAKNNFTKRMDNCQSGDYEIMEENGHAQYSFDGGKLQEDGCFTLKQENMRIDVCNPMIHEGVVLFQLMKEDCGENLVTVDDDACYEVLIKGEQEACLKLSKDNQWKCRLTLPYGEYQFILQGEEEHYYFIDHVRQKEGKLSLDSQQVLVQLIMKQPCQDGMLLLQKYMRSKTCDCLRKPCNEEAYEIEVKGENFYRIVYLNETNAYQEVLHHLEKGRYEVRELHGENVTYIINGGMEDKQGVLNINQNRNTVKIINEAEEMQQGSMEICKLMKDEEGCYCYPKADEIFWIIVKGEEGSRRVLLNEANHFYASMRNLKEGWYEVMEENGGEHVRYVVNNGAPMKKGIVHVVNNANTVNVINLLPSTHSAIQINKWIRENDQLVKPNSGEYRVHVSMPGYQNLVILNKQNQYQETLHDLKPGTYTISELDHENVSYIIDGQKETQQAIIEVNQSMHQVDVINQMMKNGQISMVKYRRVNGTMLRPQPEDSYEFYLSAPGYQKLFYLDQGNDWKMTFHDLKPATYVLTERNATDEVSYIIDEGSESNRAIIDVHGTNHQVTIINTQNISPTGSIHIEKVVRQGNELMKPEQAASYQIHVSRPGYNETFTLNASNNFTLHISDLEDGMYVLDELDETNEVTYIINGGSEINRAVIHVSGNENRVIMINTPRSMPKGSMHVEKFIRENNQLVRPQADDNYRLHVSKPGFNEVYTLDASNNFTIDIPDLEDGTYVLNEMDHDENVSYIINGGTETNNGNVVVNANANTIVMINPPTALRNGSIHVDKFIRRNNELVRPDTQNIYRLQISKPGFYQVYNLNDANHFMVDVLDLEDGMYVLNELDEEENVSYIINGGSETNQGVVTIRDNANQVKMINADQDMRKGSIQVEKWVRENNELKRPQDDQSYRLHVSKPGYNEVFTLDKSNDFKVNITQLADGFYVLDELDEKGEVSYVINGGSETRYGIVEVRRNTNTVKMINASLAKTGSIFFSKYIKNADGSLSVPADGDQYIIEVYNQEFLQRVTLNGQNNFQSTLLNLKEGIYHLRELDSSNFRVTYKINGSEETSEGVVYVQGNRNMVDVINERKTNMNTVEVFKYMLDKDDNYLPPSAPDVYRFEISAPGFKREYDLVPENNWHVTITDLSTDRYQIREITQDPTRVRYLINSPQLVEEAFFEAAPGVTNIVGIINIEDDVENGMMTLNKRIRDAMGQLVIPSNGESFVIRVKGNQFDRLVALDMDNDFTYTIENLAYGMYTIEETDSPNDVSYQIDGGEERNNARLNIQDGTNHAILIINTKNAMFFDAKKDDTVKIIID